MSLILALETSSTVCSVALFREDQMLALSELQIEKSHSSHITVMISQLLSNCGLSEKDLSAVAVSGGPGSYTGLRIGTSTAKGLCFGLNIPLIEVPTLHAMAHEVISNIAAPDRLLFCPMIDARRMEVFACVLNHRMEEILAVKPVLLDECSFDEFMQDNQVVFFGSGAEKFSKLTHGNENAFFLDGAKLSARGIGFLAYQRFIQRRFENTIYYEPFYLKDVYLTTPTK